MVKSDLNPKISIVLLDRAIQSDWILAQGGTGAAVVQLIGALTASNDDQALIFFRQKPGGTLRVTWDLIQVLAAVDCNAGAVSRC